MVAVPYPAASEGHGSSWQGIRQQLFGQKRERDAEDGLLTVITQLQTRLALAIGAHEGPLRTPALRAQALRAVQDGLNNLIAWHREQLVAAQAVGAWSAPIPSLGSDVLLAIQTLRPLFEGAEAREGTIEARDVAQAVAQLRGSESDAFFNEALDGFVAMLEAVYARIAVDPPTTPVALAMNETWAVLVDELRSLACPVEEIEEALVEAPLLEAAIAMPGSTFSGDPVTEVVSEPALGPMLDLVAPPEEELVPAPPTVMVFPRFSRLELVAC
ncbi:MAG TPA: hypothetical protein VFX49_23180 [Chloroflexota bacterium]|nr:hypothetical protein [Chloroflexota bacterium]